ncbi:unnamed protein product [Heligmosomoides polygyrus]|uniref:Reverse transcriptase domain-containing protein n=1 Tax=Heligmosomoides polygyrus TaxID=6339 RepID=A0A183G5E1_HELPZ|nr:unnamed protein product [Heligmosomoides polygyrus]
MSKDRALQAVAEILTEHEGNVNLYGLSVAQVMSLTNECLMCNVFKRSGEYYMQMRGVAMGKRLAPVLAVAFMFKTSACESFLPCPHRKGFLKDRHGNESCFLLVNCKLLRLSLPREEPPSRYPKGKQREKKILLFCSWDSKQTLCSELLPAGQ